MSAVLLPALYAADALAFGPFFVPGFASPPSPAVPQAPAVPDAIPMPPPPPPSQTEVAPLITPPPALEVPPVAASPSRPPIAAAEDLVLEPTSRLAPTRPRFFAAIGMGVSVDSSAPVGGHTVAIPAFEVLAGIGDGVLGFETRLFSSQASGRYPMVPDRLAIDVLLALHILAARNPEDQRWVRRVARAFTINLGLSGENASIGQKSVIRTGTVAGAHLDLPLTSRAEPSELRMRIGVRRMFGGKGAAGPVAVSDSGEELFAALAAAF